jgi:two-component system response regulator DctR
MQPVLNGMVFIVDDDVSVREALAWLLRSRRLPSEAFESAEAFEAMLARPGAGLGRQPACLMLDVRMPGLSGLALFDRLLERGLVDRLPVIFLTGHADVPTAVDAVKRGAFDFCEKPFSDNALVDRIEQALAQFPLQVLETRSQQGAPAERCLAELTERERDVMRLVVEGLAEQADRRPTGHQRAHGGSPPRPRV